MKKKKVCIYVFLRGEIRILLRGHDAPLVPCLFPNRLLFSHLGQNLGWKIDSHGSLVSLSLTLLLYSLSLFCVFLLFLSWHYSFRLFFLHISRASIINRRDGLFSFFCFFCFFFYFLHRKMQLCVNQTKNKKGKGK